MKIAFSFKYIVVTAIIGLLVVGVAASPHVMTMRQTPAETKKFFNENNVKYSEVLQYINGHTIHYVETGSPKNPVLVFIHGSPGSWDAFKDYMVDSDLLDKYHMISFDRIGFGESGFGNAVDLETNSKAIEAVLQKDFPESSFVLVGHSLGAPIAANLAANIPESVAHLVLLSGALDPDAEKPELWRILLLYPPISWVVPGALRPSNDELWMFKKGVYRLKETLGDIVTNVTVIHGTDDGLVPFSNVEYIKKEFTGVRSLKVLPIEGASHFIPWEHYSVIKDVLLGK